MYLEGRCRNANKITKGDESKPSCSYCVRHSVECSFLSTEPNLLPAISGLSLRSSNNARRISSDPSASGGSPYPDNGASSLCNNLHMKEFELLLHFTASTGPSISAQDPSNTCVWSTSVPHEALEHPFLMHGIFAIAAVHLSHIHQHNPLKRQEYALLAAKHENIALPLFRAESVNVTERNCPAVFAFAALVVIYAMASPSHSNGFFSGMGDGLPEWLYMLRGVDAIIRTRQHLLEGSPLATLVDLSRYQHRVLSPSDEIPLHNLGSLFAIHPSYTPERLDNLEVYRETFSYLRDSFANPVSPDLPTHPVPYIWFTLISEKFLSLLSQRRPEALILLAHQCVIMKRAEPCWFIDGVADTIMRSIMENLEPDWGYWLEWPLHEMRLDRQHDMGLEPLL